MPQSVALCLANIAEKTIYTKKIPGESLVMPNQAESRGKPDFWNLERDAPVALGLICCRGGKPKKGQWEG